VAADVAFAVAAVLVMRDYPNPTLKAPDLKISAKRIPPYLSPTIGKYPRFHYCRKLAATFDGDNLLMIARRPS
jgi:hypothetical protein